MDSTAQKLAYLEASSEAMKDFLLSQDVFWQLSESGPQGALQNLSLGEILLTLDELGAHSMHLGDEDTRRYQSARRELDALREEWRSAWSRKALKEINQRLDLWRAYLRDLEEDRAAEDRFPQEVRNRVRAERLLGEMLPGLDRKSVQELLSAADDRLRSRFHRGPFVWDEILRDPYTEPEYWFLYGQPRSS